MLSSGRRRCGRAAPGLQQEGPKSDTWENFLTHRGSATANQHGGGAGTALLLSPQSGRHPWPLADHPASFPPQPSILPWETLGQAPPGSTAITGVGTHTTEATIFLSPGNASPLPAEGVQRPQPLQ